jgi:hypothetical protein
MNHYYHYTMPYCPSLNVGIEVYRRRNPRVVVCRDLMAFPIYWSSLGASLKKQKTTILVHVLPQQLGSLIVEAAPIYGDQ